MGSPARASQSGWRWCAKCEGLWFNGDTSISDCPTGGQHVHSASGHYTLRFSYEGGGGQDNWWYCWMCLGMWFHTPGSTRFGRCPGNNHGEGSHDKDWRNSYRLETTTSNNGPGGQKNWRWCSHCESLWFNGHATWGKCPGSAAGHTAVNSADYILRVS
ncbi:hypothetical protein GCM10010532_074600 [Dactylosporangium siamense]